MRRKAVVSVLLSVVMILGSAFPAFAAGQMPSSEVSVGMESSVSDSLDDAETEQTGQDGGNIDAEQEPADAQEANEEAEAGTEEGSEEAGIEEEVSDEDSNNTEAETAEEDPTDERKTDTAEEEEEKPEALVGAEGERISVGDNVTAVFDSQTGRLSFYSYKGTLSNDWKNLIGNSDISLDSIQTITISDDSDVMYLPADSSFLFSSLAGLQSMNLSKANTSNVTKMVCLFRGCSSLKILDISGFDTSNVMDTSYMFFGCSSLESLDVSEFDTSNSTAMSFMFGSCSSLQTLDVSGFDTSNVTQMYSMFSGCSSLQTLDVSGFNTSNVTKMYSMFSGCSSLQTLDVSGFDTSNATYISGMFSGCCNLQELDVSNFSLSNIISSHIAGGPLHIGCEELFNGCSSLQQLDLSSFDMERINSANNMINCDNLLVILTPVNVHITVTLPGTFVDDSGNEYNSLPEDLAESIRLTKKSSDIPATKNIADATVTGITNKTYTGTAQTQNPTVKLGDMTLTAGTDYTLSYTNNTNAGTATVTITGKGIYTGTVSKTFTISAAFIADATISGISNKAYTGTAQTQNPMAKLGDKTLVAGTDYTLSYSNNTNAGTATVTITGKGNYTGTVSRNFTINKAAPKLTFASTSITKSTQDAAFTNALTKTTDGTVTFKSGNTSVATVNSTTGKVTIKGEGTTTITATAAAGTNYKAGSAHYTLTVTEALKIVSISDDFYGKTGTTASFHIEVEGNGAISYQWQYRTAGMTIWKSPAQESAKTADYSFNMKPSYDNIEVRCIVSDDSGTEIISETRKANVFAFTSQPSDAVAEEGQVVNFEVSAIGRGVTYQWYYMRPNGAWTKATASGARTAVFPITAGTKNDGTAYRCVITDEEGNQITSAAGILTVNMSLRITGLSEDAYAVNGKSVNFHIEAVGKGTLTYQWQYRMATMREWKAPAQASAKTPDYSFNMKPSYDNIEVRCIVSDDSGNYVTSETRKANVFAFTSQPADVNASAGQIVEFKVSAIGRGVTYQWYYMRPNSAWSKTTVSGSRTAILPITAGTKNDGTSYRCVITDEEGNQITSTAGLLTVDTRLRITGISGNAYDVSGESVTFHVDAVGSGALSYQWQYKLAGESGWRTPGQESAKTADYVFKLKPSYDNIEVRCIVKDSAGNTCTSDVRKANVFAITKQPDIVFAELGERVTFSVKGIGQNLTYQWYYRRLEGDWKKVTAAGYNTSSLTVTAQVQNNGSQYRCYVYDGVGNLIKSRAAMLIEIDEEYES